MLISAYTVVDAHGVRATGNALIGTRLLGEPFGGLRILASVALALGLVLMQTS